MTFLWRSSTLRLGWQKPNNSPPKKGGAQMATKTRAAATMEVNAADVVPPGVDAALWGKIMKAVATVMTPEAPVEEKVDPVPDVEPTTLHAWGRITEDGKGGVGLRIVTGTDGKEIVANRSYWPRNFGVVKAAMQRGELQPGTYPMTIKRYTPRYSLITEMFTQPVPLGENGEPQST